MGTNDVLGIHSLAEMKKKGFGQMYREKMVEAYTNDWYFSGWEKILISACFVWSMYSLGKFLLGLL